MVETDGLSSDVVAFNGPNTSFPHFYCPHANKKDIYKLFNLFSAGQAQGNCNLISQNYISQNILIRFAYHYQPHLQVRSQQVFFPSYLYNFV